MLCGVIEEWSLVYYYALNEYGVFKICNIGNKLIFMHTFFKFPNCDEISEIFFKSLCQIWCTF